jgi:hypothetical protein
MRFWKPREVRKVSPKKYLINRTQIFPGRIGVQRIITIEKGRVSDTLREVPR